jgi:hypothetical protein
MKDKKVPLKEWVDMLSEYYKVSTIKRYYRQHKGSETALVELRISSYEKRRRNRQFESKLESILMRRVFRAIVNYEYSGIGIIRQRQNVKKAGGSYEMHREGNDVSVTLTGKPTVIHIKVEIEFGHKEKEKFKKFFSGLSYYFTYAKNDVDIIRLEDILKKYHIKVLKIKALKTLIKKQSIYDENKAIEEILNTVQNLLYINNNELHRSIPNTLPIQSIKEITSETISELVQLELKLDKNITYSKLLEDLRQI